MNKMIKKIELDLGGKIISLTPEQAKNLKSALDDLFTKEVIREYVPYPVFNPLYPTPYRDWFPPQWYYGDTFTCGEAWSCGSDTLRITG